MLSIKNLHATINGEEVLHGINLEVKEGEIHAIMGPNGSGKSTLSKIIAGHPAYEVTKGEILYDINMNAVNLTSLRADERAREGIFLAFQYPIEVPGVSNFEFLRTAFNAVATHQGAEELDSFDFQRLIETKLKDLQMDVKFLSRHVNVDFSGGEKKRNEILQMAVLQPRLALLDETDSGLDVDSLQQVAQALNKLKTPENAYVLVTHYHRILEHVVPDHIHILANGRIVHSGDHTLALEIEKNGYEPFLRGIQE